MGRYPGEIANGFGVFLLANGTALVVKQVGGGLCRHSVKMLPAPRHCSGMCVLAGAQSVHNLTGCCFLRHVVCR
jgi:hypothetical protein